MKKLLLAFFVSVSFLASAQKQKEEYCEIIFVTAKGGFSSKMDMIISRGNNESGIVKENYYSIVQGLNRMAEDGWQLVLSYDVGTIKEAFPRFLFKREFDKLQFKKDSTEAARIQLERSKQINIIQNTR